MNPNQSNRFEQLRESYKAPKQLTEQEQLNTIMKDIQGEKLPTPPNAPTIPAPEPVVPMEPAPVPVVDIENPTLNPPVSPLEITPAVEPTGNTPPFVPTIPPAPVLGIAPGVVVQVTAQDSAPLFGVMFIVGAVNQDYVHGYSIGVNLAVTYHTTKLANVVAIGMPVKRFKRPVEPGWETKIYGKQN